MSTHNELRELVERFKGNERWHWLEMMRSEDPVVIAARNASVEAWSLAATAVSELESLLSRAPADTREAAMVTIERGEDGVPTVWCDPEIADLVSALNAAGIRTIASCSGHGERLGNIALKDGRELLILQGYDAARDAERTLGMLAAAPYAQVADEDKDDLLANCYRQMAAVWDFLRPNESKDMEWADEIIIAIQNRAPAVEVDEAMVERALAVMFPSKHDDHLRQNWRETARNALAAALGREGGGNV